jgi:uncharacterized protein
MDGFPSRSYIAFPSLHERPLTVAARLLLPAGTAKAPAVILLHGSAGPTARESGYADLLHAAGFVTLEPDQWAARGLAGGSEGRPKTIHETLPDVYGARAFLAAHPRVDAARIGVMGFSFGGVATMLAATRAENGRFLADGCFKAMMAFYPACWIYGALPGMALGALVDAPLLLVTGGADDYDDDPQAGPKLVAQFAPEDRARVRTTVFAGAHHGFDMPGVDVVVTDPLSHRGQGGPAVMRCDPQAMGEARRIAVAFFRETLGVS